jgi:hypothetical protein
MKGDHVVVSITGHVAEYQGMSFNLEDKRAYTALLTWLHQDGYDVIRNRIKMYMLSYFYGGHSQGPAEFIQAPYYWSHTQQQSDPIYIDYAETEEKVAAALTKDGYIRELQDRALAAERDRAILEKQFDEAVRENVGLKIELTQYREKVGKMWGTIYGLRAMIRRHDEKRMR